MEPMFGSEDYELDPSVSPSSREGIVASVISGVAVLSRGSKSSPLQPLQLLSDVNGCKGGFCTGFESLRLVKSRVMNALFLQESSKLLKPHSSKN